MLAEVEQKIRDFFYSMDVERAIILSTTEPDLLKIGILPSFPLRALRRPSNLDIRTMQNQKLTSGTLFSLNSLKV